MGSAVVPERPLLKPWYRLASDGDTLLLEHGGTVVRFGGAAARELLPRLLPLLDGTRTTDELVEIVGRPVSPAIAGALDLLAEHQLLTDGPSRTRSADAEALAESSGVPAATVRDRLAAAELAVIGPPARAEALGRFLHAAGIGTVTSRLARSTDLTVVLAKPDERSTFATWNRRALDQGLAWLPAGDFDGVTATVGPLVIPRETACHECLVIRRASTSGCARELTTLRRVPRACLLPATVEALVLATTAHVALRWMGLRDPALPGAVVTVEAGVALDVSAQTLLRVPRCPACSPTRSAASPLPWHETERGSP